jgi:hypothetical protein
MHTMMTALIVAKTKAPGRKRTPAAPMMTMPKKNVNALAVPPVRSTRAAAVMTSPANWT